MYILNQSLLTISSNDNASLGSYLEILSIYDNFRYGVFKVGYNNVEAAVVYEDDFVKITIPLIILWIYVLILILREFWQIFKYK